MSTTVVLTETIDISEASIDAENRVLRGAVLISAGESANKRDYPAAVLQASVPVFEGVKAYADHPLKTDLKERAERSIRDITGWYSNVRFENNRLMADRYFAPTQAGQDAWSLAEMIANGKAPRTLAGLSINAVGKAKKREDGGLVIESIEFAHSVDDVTSPAAGGSYLESEERNDLARAFYEALDYDEWVSIREEYTARYDQEHRKVRRNARLNEVIEARDKYAARCQQLQAENASLQEARDTAAAEAQQAQRVVRVMEALAKVNLPASWKDSLRKRLMVADPEQWGSILSDEQSKAKAAGHQPKVPVSVPAPQAVSNPVLKIREDLSPRDDEDPVTWAARVRAARQQR